MIRKIFKRISLNKDVLNALLSFATGLLCFCGFPPVDIGFFAWIAFIPLFFLIKNCGYKKAFLYSYLSGIVFFGCLLYWLNNVTIPGAIILVLILSIFYGLFGFGVKFVLKYSINKLILPFMWVVLEFIRSNLFTGFPWGLLGYTQYKNLNIIQIADITGVYGISFMIIAFNYAAFAFVTRSKRRISYMMVALMFILLSTVYGVYRFDNMTLRGETTISVVQGNIPQREKWNPDFAAEIFGKYEDLSKQVVTLRSDLIVWPETAFPYLVGKDPETSEDISLLSDELKTPILAGVVYKDNDTYYNSAFLFDKDKGIVQKYLKTHLVPFGEYIPFGKILNNLRNVIDKPIGNFGWGKDYTLFPLRSVSVVSGSNGERVRSILFLKFGVLICFEDIFPYIAREFVSSGADLIINITNDAWFGKTAAARQHLQASVFRAVENRVPVVRAANTGISCFINPTGKIVSILKSSGEEIFFPGTETSKIDVTYPKTYYTLKGDMFVYFCAFLLLLVLLSEWYYVRKEK